ncbi:MAG TPA: bifunctional phosphoribosyl-AMP cyclohydrolase/phosphoribosyl-ATP diphosphatase HisIE [Kofleriaceae bacterium]|nr:bifunctional phosphoribosyl-AMP cyclohydrolase/phosphoribosyl-ATP diphosphatase HisIE [Kofleriaceae bacterium]
MNPADVKWDERGLVPAVVSDARTGAVLMLGWMNAEALAATAASGEVTFFSRSRQTLWRKGETSGNTLAVRAIRLDCDGDAILVEAEPVGPTCHTGAASCFYRRSKEDGWAADGGPRGAPSAVVDRVYAVLETRVGAPASRSYTAALLAGGIDTIARKIDEESTELIDELVSSGDRKRIVHEAADLLYHVLAGLLAQGVSPDEVWGELERRFGTSGLAEKAARR